MFKKHAMRLLRRYWSGIGGTYVKGDPEELTIPEIVKAVKGNGAAIQKLAEEIASLIGDPNVELTHNAPVTVEVYATGDQSTDSSDTTLNPKTEMFAPVKSLNPDSHYGPDSDGNNRVNNGFGMVVQGVAQFILANGNNGLFQQNNANILQNINIIANGVQADYVFSDNVYDSSGTDSRAYALATGGSYTYTNGFASVTLTTLHEDGGAATLASNELTVVIPGFYLIIASVRPENAAATVVDVLLHRLFVAGATVIGDVTIDDDLEPGFTPSKEHVTMFDMATLAVGDVVKVQGAYTDGTDSPTITATQVGMIRIG